VLTAVKDAAAEMPVAEKDQRWSMHVLLVCCDFRSSRCCSGYSSSRLASRATAVPTTPAALPAAAFFLDS
jgi:hypothetical protein